MVRIGLLGPVVAIADRQVALTGAQQRRLVAALALAGGERVTTDRLVESVWGDDPPRSARRSLHAQVSRLRRAFAAAGAPQLPVRVADGYALPSVECDAAIFRARVADARAALRAGEHAAASALLAEALALWRGEVALADARELGVLELEARLLDEERLGAIEDRAETALSEGDGAAVVPELRRALSEHPLRQRVAFLLMSALAGAGEPAEALEVYERTRKRLREELGITPGPELRQLHAAIVADEPRIDPPPRAVPPPFELGALQRRKLEYLFRALDEDGDSLVEGESFRRHAARMASLARDERTAEEIRSSIESWWDGVAAIAGDEERASLDAWLRFWGSWLAVVTRNAEEGGGPELQRLKRSAHRTFSVIDADGDGRIDRSEYARWIGSWGLGFDAERNFDRLGPDADGYLDEEKAVQLVKEFFLSNDPEAPGNFLYGPAF